MAFRKGHRSYATKASVRLSQKTRQYNLLTDARKKYKGNQIIAKFGSMIEWDSLRLEKIKGRTRRFVTIICGKCKQKHNVSFHNLIKQIRKPFYTGCCKKCVDNMSWLEEGRPRPEKRKTTNHGYIKLYLPENPMADKRGEVYEHRLVMSDILGRPLEKWEHVHHKDGNRTNNSRENLELHPNSEHITIKEMTNRIALLESVLREHRIPLPK